MDKQGPGRAGCGGQHLADRHLFVASFEFFGARMGVRGEV